MTQPIDTPEEAVRRVVAERAAALVRRDVAALERILAPGFVYTNASGEVLDKESYLARYVHDPDVASRSIKKKPPGVFMPGGFGRGRCKPVSRKP